MPWLYVCLVALDRLHYNKLKLLHAMVVCVSGGSSPAA